MSASTQPRCLERRSAVVCLLAAALVALGAVVATPRPAAAFSVTTASQSSKNLKRFKQSKVYYFLHPKGSDDMPAATALKVLRDGDPQSVRRFRQEARVLGALRHPHLLRVYEHGEHDGQPFLALELIDGEDLGALVARGGTPPRHSNVSIESWCSQRAAMSGPNTPSSAISSSVMRSMKGGPKTLSSASLSPRSLQRGFLGCFWTGLFRRCWCWLSLLRCLQLQWLSKCSMRWVSCAPPPGGSLLAS